MANLSDVQRKIRKDKKWGFLAEMIGETDLDLPTAGVNYRGVLLVNPRRAVLERTDVLVKRVRSEFRQAQELREGVNGFR